MQDKILVSGNYCSGIVKTNPTKEDIGYIFLVKTLSIIDYSKIINSIGVICESGGITSHMAVICRIQRIPIILIKNATHTIHDGMKISIDSKNGNLSTTEHEKSNIEVNQYENLIELLSGLNFQISIIEPDSIPPTNLFGESKISQFFLRAEFLWIRENQNPLTLLKEKGRKLVEEKLYKNIKEYITKINKHQYLNFRSLDIRTDEFPMFNKFNNIQEKNPQIGLHGIRHLLIESDLLIAEIRALDRLYEEGHRNIIFSLPFINDELELLKAYDYISKHSKNKLKTGIFVETPSAVIQFDEMCELGLDFAYIGSKDLTQTILACDRGNSNLSHIYDSKKKAVTKTIQYLINKSNDKNLNIFLFVLLRDIEFFLKEIKNIKNISLCLGDFYQIFHPRLKLRK